MPFSELLFIGASVGAGGKNNGNDVGDVQERLNNLMHAPRVKLVVDGIAGRKTKRTIRDFQKTVVGFNWPDGRVDPGGKTLNALNDPLSEAAWGVVPYVPEEDIKPPKPDNGKGSALNPDEDDAHEEFHDAIADAVGDSSWATDFLNFLMTDYPVAAKALLGAINVGKNLEKVARGIKVLKDAGLSASQAAKVVGVMVSNRSAPVAIAYLIKFAESSGPVANAFKSFSKATTVMAVVICVIECIGDFEKGNYGVAAGRIYKCGMGIALPWASLLNAIQAILVALAPSLKGNRAFEITFKILSAANPMELGAAHFDNLVTLVQFTVKSIRDGAISWGTLDKLADRLRGGSTGLWSQMGDYIADSLQNDDVEMWIYENILS